MRYTHNISWSKRNNLAQCYSAIDLNKYVQVEKAAKIAIASSNANIEQICYRSEADLSNNHDRSLNFSVVNNDNSYKEEVIQKYHQCHQEYRGITKETYDEFLSDVMQPRILGAQKTQAQEAREKMESRKLARD